VSNNFYKAFEDKHRGSRVLIKSRLQVYLPFIKPLDDIYTNSQTLDLGCGRGEWLELLTEQTQFDAHGVDLDEGMLKVCKQHKLQYKLQDALACLKEMKDESLTVITAFHLIEHIPFSDLQELIQQALRVLKPAGLLILETPNPENIVVGTAEFYMDPTHKQPIPPNLLTFIPDFYGFKQTKIIRLQENDGLAKKPIAIIDVLRGVSPDYAVIAQKSAPIETLAQFKTVFAKEYGVTLEELAEKYNQQLIREVQMAEAKKRTADAKMQEIEDIIQELDVRMCDKIQKVEKRIQIAEAKTQEAEAKTQEAEVKTQAAEAKIQTTEERIEALLSSRSWQYTKPIRAVISGGKKVIK